MSSNQVGRVSARVLLALLSLAVAGACATSQQANVRTFPEVCPKGWTFLYADYTAQGASSTAPPAVCRKDSTAVAN